MFDQRNYMKRRNIKKTAAAFKLASASVASSVPAVADWNYNPSTWNGYRIYLSPARHSDTGMRGECASDENTMAQNVALGATGGSGTNLLDRQYQVQVGTGTVASAIANSNAWGADAHIPIHSNARTESCSTTNASVHGTVVIYHQSSTNGSVLAAQLRDRVGAVSPGTNDYKCKNPGDPCTTINLGELSNTVATAAYLETEFHTWNTGTSWIQQTGWKWRIGWAVDEFYGYPRSP